MAASKVAIWPARSVEEIKERYYEGEGEVRGGGEGGMRCVQGKAATVAVELQRGWWPMMGRPSAVFSSLTSPHCRKLGGTFGA